MQHGLLAERHIIISPKLASTIGLEESVMLHILNDYALPFSDGWVQLGNDQLRSMAPFWTDIDLNRLLKSLTDKGMIRLQSGGFPNPNGVVFYFDPKQQAAQTPTNGSGSQVPNTQSNQGNTQGSGTQGSGTQVNGSQVSRSQAGEKALTNSQTNHPPQALVQTQRHEQFQGGATRIAPDWQPNSETMKALAQRNVSKAFALEQLDRFILYYRDKGDVQHSWHNLFVKWVLRQHEQMQGRDQSPWERNIETVRPIDSNWRPSKDAHQILLRDQIDPQFVRDAIPEFILYWQEMGLALKTWNSKFIEHVRKQWHKLQHAQNFNTQPQPITDNWQPSPEVYDILAMANIDRAFAQSIIREFVLYWRDSGQLHASWNSKFLQYVKHSWAKRLTSGQSGNNNGQTTQRNHTASASVAQIASDTSWAE